MKDEGQDPSDGPSDEDSASESGDHPSILLRRRRFNRAMLMECQHRNARANRTTTHNAPWSPRGRGLGGHWGRVRSQAVDPPLWKRDRGLGCTPTLLCG